MDLHELLDHLDASGARLTESEHRLALDGPSSVRADLSVLAVIGANRDLLLAHVLGARTGHALGRCTECGAMSLTHYRPASKYPPCRLTPACPGRHEPRPVDVAQLTARRAPARPKVGGESENPPTNRLLGPRPAWPQQWPTPGTRRPSGANNDH